MGGFYEALRAPKREKLFYSMLLFGPLTVCSVKVCSRGAEKTQTGTHIPHLVCRESYYLGSHFGTILDPFGGGLGGFKTVFLVILSFLKFVKKSPTESLWGV